MRKLLFVFAFISNTITTAPWHDCWENSPRSYIVKKIKKLSLSPEKIANTASIILFPFSSVSDVVLAENNGKWGPGYENLDETKTVDLTMKITQSCAIFIDIYYLRLLMYVLKKSPDILKSDLMTGKSVLCAIKSKLCGKREQAESPAQQIAEDNTIVNDNATAAAEESSTAQI